MAFRDLLESRDGSLKSWAFHVSSSSSDSKRIKSIKALLTQPGVCYSVDEVSSEHASHVLEEDYRRQQHEIHEVKDLELGSYLQEVSEVLSRIDDAGGVYRFKVLVDLGVLDSKAVDGLLRSVEGLRRQ